MVATVISGSKLVTLPEHVRKDLGLEDGVEYVAEPSGDGVILRPSDSAERVSYSSMIEDGLNEHQAAVLRQVDQLYGSLAQYRSGTTMSRSDEREAFEQAVAEENASDTTLGQ